VPQLNAQAALQRGSKWIVLAIWFGLPWMIINGLVYYGESVAQSVTWAAVEVTATAAFLICAAGGLVLLAWSKKYNLPRIIIVGLAIVYISIGFTGFPHYSCGPQYVQSQDERQKDAGAKAGSQTQSTSAARGAKSCS
jgi:hypothetical protein